MNSSSHLPAQGRQKDKYETDSHDGSGIGAAFKHRTHHERTGRGNHRKRKKRQQARIKQGQASGQLTKKESSNLQRRESNLNNEINNDRSANGGKLTKAQQKRVHNEQNAISRKIYQDKHNDDTQPGVAPTRK